MSIADVGEDTGTAETFDGPDVTDDQLDQVDAALDAAEAEAEAALDTEQATQPPTKALAGELANQAAQYDAALIAEKRAEGVFEDTDAVFDGPFDVEKAWAVVSRINQEYQDAIREEKRTKERHTEAPPSSTASSGRRSCLRPSSGASRSASQRRGARR